MLSWKKMVIASAALCSASVIGQASELTPIPDNLQHCTVCHGTQFMGNASNGAPRLSDLQPWYIKNQLIAFRNDWRGSHADDIQGSEMLAAAKALDEETLQATADFVASTQSALPPVTLDGDIEKGKQLFISCQACHGAKGQGNEAIQAPALAGLNDWYIAKQLNNFLDSKRGYHGTDSNGAIMKAATLILPDEQAVKDVATYIASINQPVIETTQETTETSGENMKKSSLVAAALASTLTMSAVAEPKRYPLPNNSTFPIARAVEVPAGTTLVYHSGQVPSPEDTTAERGSRKFYGSTYTQSMSVFKKFEASLKDMGLDFSDAVKLTVFLVGDPEMEGKMDFMGFMKAYTQYFGTEENPNLPARSAIQIAGLAGGPGMLVEIEMVLARPTE